MPPISRMNQKQGDSMSVYPISTAFTPDITHVFRMMIGRTRKMTVLVIDESHTIIRYQAVIQGFITKNDRMIVDFKTFPTEGNLFSFTP